MNLIQLKYFRAICTYRTVSAAAQYLHISQPSLSSAIKELEQEFGVLLFTRTHQGMRTTAEGDILLKMCDDLLSRADTVEQVMGDLGNERKTLRLGVPPMIGSLILPQILREFLSDNPDIRLEITEGGSFELQKMLSDDILDTVFLPHNRPLESSYFSQKLGRLEIVCCVSKDNPLAAKTSVYPADLEDVPLVLFSDGFYQTEEIRHWFSVAGVSPEILMQTSQLSTALTVISHNTAAGFLFRRLIDKTPELAAIPTESPISVDVSIVRKQNSYNFNSMKKFCEYMEQNNPFKE